MKQYPFEHDGPVYIMEYANCKVAYYARDGKKYRRHSSFLSKSWDNDTEEEIDNATFWMTVACIERGSRHA